MAKILGLLGKVILWIGAIWSEEGVPRALVTYFSLAVFSAVESALVLAIGLLAKYSQRLLASLDLPYFQAFLVHALHYLALVCCVFGAASLIMENSPGPLGRVLRSLLSALETFFRPR